MLALIMAQSVYAAKAEESCLSPLSQTTAFYRMVPGNPKTTEIMTKMQAAIQKDPHWFQEHAKKAGPGQPLRTEDRCFLNVDLKKMKQGVPTLREEFTIKW